MNNEKDKQLNQINLDILFFFLLIVSTIISFYIIVEKKKAYQNKPHKSKEELNNMYNFNKYFIIFIDIYFLINAYISYKNLEKNNKDYKHIQEQKIIIIANVLALISALLYIPIQNSSIEIVE